MSDSSTVRSLVRRVALLRRLDSKPADIDVLQSSVDRSRPTVRRAVSDLQETGYVEQSDGQFRTTLTGRLALELYDQFLTTMNNIQTMTDILSTLDPAATLTPVVFANAEIIRPESHSEHLTPTTHTNGTAVPFEEVIRIRTIVLSLTSQRVELYNKWGQNDIDVSIVISPPLIERLATDHHEQFQGAIATGNIDLKQATEKPPFGLKIVETVSDTIIELRVYGAEGRGIIINDTPKAVAWADAFYTDERENALSIHTSDRYD
jgi:predicted transcriptional regulator